MGKHHKTFNTQEQSMSQLNNKKTHDTFPEKRREKTKTQAQTKTHL